MDQLFDLKTYEDYLESIRTWMVENAVTLGASGLAQIVVVGLAFLAGYGLVAIWNAGTEPTGVPQPA